MKRAYLTKQERAAMALAQNGLCGCGCGAPLSAQTIAEHTTPVALGNEAKPDALYNKTCADAKTNGFLGDKHKIAKTRRIANGKTQADKRAAKGSKMRSRGFQSWRDFAGNVIKRER